MAENPLSPLHAGSTPASTHPQLSHSNIETPSRLFEAYSMLIVPKFGPIGPLD
jgi:hypothetical protein